MTDTPGGLSISQLFKYYGNVQAVRGIDLHVDRPEFMTLLGPSGSGKTTLLRCIAGLEAINGGEISLDGRLLNSTAQRVAVPPERRGFGMVFQSYALWPHMTVAKNVAYPLKMRGVKNSKTHPSVHEVLDLVGLAPMANRSVGMLSGGQQQRVALARALVTHPEVMLFDEPMSNLDTTLRESLRQYILDAHRTAGGMSVYVTHDQSEALYLSDRIAVMFDGRIRQLGTPAEIYSQPADTRVAAFLGFDNFLPGTVVEAQADTCLVRLNAQGQLVRARAGNGVRVGGKVAVAIRGQHIAVRSDQRVAGGEAHNEWKATVSDKRQLQSMREYQMDFTGHQLTVRRLDAPDTGAGELADFSVGDVLRLTVHPTQAIALQDGTQHQDDTAEQQHPVH